jgi:hypothetical protein
METNKHSITCPNCGHIWYNKNNFLLYQENEQKEIPLCSQPRLARGRRLPPDLTGKAKIKEGKNTLSAIAKAYGIQQSHLSYVLSGKRNTKHLIEILESEYRMPISELREFIAKRKRNRDEADAIYKNQQEGLDGSQIRI